MAASHTKEKPPEGGLALFFSARARRDHFHEVKKRPANAGLLANHVSPSNASAIIVTLATGQLPAKATSEIITAVNKVSAISANIFFIEFFLRRLIRPL